MFLGHERTINYHTYLSFCNIFLIDTKLSETQIWKYPGNFSTLYLFGNVSCQGYNLVGARVGLANIYYIYDVYIQILYELNIPNLGSWAQT